MAANFPAISSGVCMCIMGVIECIFTSSHMQASRYMNRDALCGNFRPIEYIFNILGRE